MQGLTRALNRLVLSALAAVAVAASGVLAASITGQAVYADAVCENDRCVEACIGGSCYAECQDTPGSERNCDSTGPDTCNSTPCDPT